jgi:hypothetical protein
MHVYGGIRTYNLASADLRLKPGDHRHGREKYFLISISTVELQMLLILTCSISYMSSTPTT